MASVFTSLAWAAVRLGFAVRSSALMAGIRASEMIRVPALTAAPAYMSLTAVSTGAGAGGRGGWADWPPDGQGWYMVTFLGRGSLPGAGGYICYPQPAPNMFTATLGHRNVGFPVERDLAEAWPDFAG